MTFNKKIFSNFQEQDVSIQVEFTGNDTYPVTIVDSILFQMPSGDVLELHDYLFIASLEKNLISISDITDLKCLVEFDDQQCTIRDYSQERGCFWPNKCEKETFIGCLLMQ